MAAVTICSDFGAQKIKSVTVSIVSPSISLEMMGSGAMIFIFWMLGFKPTFSLSSFTFIKRLFSSSSVVRQWKQWADFIFWGSKITADGDPSHEIKRRILLGRKIMTNLDCILKSRHTTLTTKVYLVKAMVFPEVMYGCENWTIRKAERWRIDALELWYWRRLLRVPWTPRRSNQPILKEISPGCSLEGLMLKLKLQYFGHLVQRADSFEKTLVQGKIEGRGGEADDRGWDGWMASLAQWTWVWVGSACWCWTGRTGELYLTRSQRVGHDWATELNWTEF